MNRATLSLMLACALSASAAEPEKQPSAARSVHLWYAAPESALFYNEVTVQESHPGSYFCACGFQGGYFGIQELSGPDDKVVIFSVWDPGDQNDPGSVPADQRVQVLYQGDGVQIKRFGGEGTGGQSFLKYPWKVGETCRFLLQATVKGDRTAYAAYFYRNDTREWKHMATFATLARNVRLKGYYSFIEDFRRDGRSARQSRSARYTNGWVRTEAGDWISLTRAKFTADNTPTLNIDAGVVEDGFRLATGGETKATLKLGESMSRPPKGLLLPEFRAESSR